jgi:hypothetical protein
MNDLREEIKNLRGALDGQETIIRDVDAINEALKAANAEVHDTAQDLLKRLDEARRRAEAAEAVIRMNAGKTRAMFSRIFQMEIRAARLEGYIDCADKRAAVAISAVRNPKPGDIVDFGRDAMLDAVSEGERDRIIEAMDEETLDRVLGRTGDEHSDILR